MSAVSDDFSRAGFWRRAVAWLVDTSLIVAALQFLGLAAFALTDGAVQSSEALFSTVNCRQLDGSVPGLEIPASFRVDSAIECTRGLFGLPQSKFARFTQRMRFVGGTQEASVAVSLDARGRYVRALDLSWLALLLFVALRIALETGGRRSPGRRLAGIRLVGEKAGIIDKRTALIRYAAMFAPLAPAVALAAWIGSLRPFAAWERFDLSGFLAAIAFAATPAAIAAAWATIDVVRRKDAYYDRVAGSAVIRD